MHATCALRVRLSMMMGSGIAIHATTMFVQTVWSESENGLLYRFVDFYVYNS